jgi:hypothetical protein
MMNGWIGVFALGVAASAAMAQDFEQHAVHEHGRVILNIAVEQNTLAVELEAPAVNVVGFEHEPDTDAQRKTVSDTVVLLQSGRGLFGVPRAAGCKLSETDVQTPQATGVEHKSADGAAKTSGHKDYRALFSFTCANTAALTWIEPWILSKLRGVTEATVNVLTASKQSTEPVTSARARVALR